MHGHIFISLGYTFRSIMPGLNLEELSSCLAVQLYHFYIPISHVWGFQFLHILVNICFIIFFYLSRLRRLVMLCQCGFCLPLLNLMLNINVLIGCLSSEKCLLPIFNGVFHHHWVVRFLRIFWRYVKWTVEVYYCFVIVAVLTYQFTKDI